MFPNSDDAPTELSEFAVHPAVTGLVCGEFLFPECTVASGDFTMLGAAVPKTTVHKESEPHSPENEIGFAENFLPSPPAGDAVLAK